jgi:isocitrate/isopropylmalate dehydrogenase
MTRHRIALIPGDGIGAEVLPPAQALLDAVGRRHGIEFAYDSCDFVLRAVPGRRRDDREAHELQETVECLAAERPTAAPRSHPRTEDMQ